MLSHPTKAKFFTRTTIIDSNSLQNMAGIATPSCLSGQAMSLERAQVVSSEEACKTAWCRCGDTIQVYAQDRVETPGRPTRLLLQELPGITLGRICQRGSTSRSLGISRRRTDGWYATLPKIKQQNSLEKHVSSLL